MAENDVERKAPGQRQHDVEPCARVTDSDGKSFLRYPEQLFQCPAASRYLRGIGGVLRIMEMQYLDLADAEGFQAFFEGAPCPRGIEPSVFILRSSFVERTKLSGRPPRSRITDPIRSSLRPKP